MASPQAENGHTDLNHENLERLYSLDLSGSEFRIILYIIRRTWGWKKKDCVVKTSTMVTETKLSKKSVCEAVNKLVTKRLLITDKDGRKVTYKFNKDYDEWKVTERKLGGYEKVTSKLRKGNLHKAVKRNILKEITIKKEIYLDILNFYNHLFNKEIRTTSTFEENMDYWMTIYSLDEIKKAMEVAKKDKWWSDKLTPVKLFRKKNTQGEKVDYIGDLLNKETKEKSLMDKYK
jgi:phage replication O-like protein O